MHEWDKLQHDRRELMRECGLDAFYNPPEVWLSIAVAAEARGELQYQRDLERAMEISNRRFHQAEATNAS